MGSYANATNIGLNYVKKTRRRTSQVWVLICRNYFYNMLNHQLNYREEATKFERVNTFTVHCIFAECCIAGKQSFTYSFR
jgi:hypothetical protein